MIDKLFHLLKDQLVLNSGHYLSRLTKFCIFQFEILYRSCGESHFLEQKLRIGLVLGRLTILKKKVVYFSTGDTSPCNFYRLTFGIGT